MIFNGTLPLHIQNTPLVLCKLLKKLVLRFKKI